jgi:hypothetical protein
LNILENVVRIIEKPAIMLLSCGFSHLAVNAGIRADLGRNVVYSQALSETPGWNGSI